MGLKDKCRPADIESEIMEMPSDLLSLDSVGTPDHHDSSSSTEQEAPLDSPKITGVPKDHLNMSIGDNEKLESQDLSLISKDVSREDSPSGPSNRHLRCPHKLASSTMLAVLLQVVHKQPATFHSFIQTTRTRRRID